MSGAEPAEAPVFAAVAPGRVNLIGEHTDYSGGWVLPMAIQDATTVVLREERARPEVLRVRSRTLGAEVALPWPPENEPLRPIPSGDPRFWVNYVLGPLAELRAAGVEVPALRVSIDGTVPPGAGLSSSASLEVAVLVAALARAGERWEPARVAAAAQRAEHAFPGTPCGIMDMTVSAAAREGCALLLDCRSGEIVHEPLPPSHVVAVFDTGVRHSLAAGEYASRRREVEEAARLLGIATLRDATPAMVERLPPALGRRARHVVTENARTVAAAEALRAGDAARAGALMWESHRSLRDDFQVSCAELDAVVEACRAEGAPRVAGARMTGGGFGGCAVALLSREEAPSTAARVAARVLQAGGWSPRWFITAAAAGARLIVPGAERPLP